MSLAAGVLATMRLFQARDIPLRCISDGGIAQLLKQGLTPEQIVESVCGSGVPVVGGHGKGARL